MRNPFTIQRFPGKTCTQTYKLPERFTEKLHFLLCLGEKCQNPSPATRVWVSRCKQFCISSGIETGAGLSLQAVEQASSDSAWISVALCWNLICLHLFTPDAAGLSNPNYHHSQCTQRGVGLSVCLYLGISCKKEDSFSDINPSAIQITPISSNAKPLPVFPDVTAMIRKRLQHRKLKITFAEWLQKWQKMNLQWLKQHSSLMRKE